MPVDGYPGELDALRAENTRLRHLLQLTQAQAQAAEPDQTAAGTLIDRHAAPESKVRFYLDLFGGRSDIYAVRWENRSDGRSGWAPAIRGQWRKGMSAADASYLPLTADVVDRHLRGKHHIGVYPLADDDTCRWVAADFDKDTAMLDALAYLKAARASDIPAALEVSQSGRGAHVWIFFAAATPAALARRIATGLLAEANCASSSEATGSTRVSAMPIPGQPPHVHQPHRIVPRHQPIRPTDLGAGPLGHRERGCVARFDPVAGAAVDHHTDAITASGKEVRRM